MPISIPSRRVGDYFSFGTFPISVKYFHPLKAGRRLARVLSVDLVIAAFPSPQGGSETPKKRRPPSRLINNFHPLKAGRRLSRTPTAATSLRVISIPSRRVGDGDGDSNMRCSLSYFHPLKAGRRLARPLRPTAPFSISIPSRRVGDQKSPVMLL